jgi:hypothetical protein
MGWETLSNSKPTRIKGTPMVATSTSVSKTGKVRTDLHLADTFVSGFGEGEANKLLKVRVDIGTDEHAGQVMVAHDPNGNFGAKRNGKGGMRLSLPSFRGSPLHKSGSTPCCLVDSSPNHFVIALPIDTWSKEVDAIERSKERSQSRETNKGSVAQQDCPEKVQGGYKPTTSEHAEPPTGGSAVQTIKTTEPVAERQPRPSVASTGRKTASAASAIPVPSSPRPQPPSSVIVDKGVGTPQRTLLRPVAYLVKKGDKVHKTMDGHFYMQDVGILSRKAVMNRINHHRAANGMATLMEYDIDWDCTEESLGVGNSA